MEITVHHQVLLSVFAIALVLGAVANKTHFCTLGAVSDWINIGDTGRLRAWLLAMAVALGGVLLLQATGQASLAGTTTFPPYRTPAFAWLRYVLGGLMFGIGMTLASGCGNKTLIRIGGGNLKSVVVLVVAAGCAYLMVWTDFYARAFNAWIGPTAIELDRHGIASQALGDVLAAATGGDGGRLNMVAGVAVALALAAIALASRDFRASRDNVLGGVTVGLAITAGWYVTAGPLGIAWKDYADMAAMPPSRVEAQSFTFISPMADTLRYLMSPNRLELINFGIMALCGVIAGSFLYAAFTRNLRLEWFANANDAARHVAGGALLGLGGVLAMGCTIGQAVTGISTLALGSFLTFAAIVAGAAGTMKFQYWLMMREAG